MSEQSYEASPPAEGRADAEEDARRAGADVDGTGADPQTVDSGEEPDADALSTDTDGVPVGSADADADAANAGADEAL